MRARWFVRGDLDGFFGLALDNLIQLLLIVALCRNLLGFGDALLYGRVLPAVGLSLLVGNVFYAWQGMQLARREKRADVCALPYGINTVSLFIFVFLVMLPVKIDVETKTGDAALAATMAWRAGLMACLGSGLIEFFGAFVVDRVRRHVPRAALLSTLAGIALTFISLDFLFRTYAAPVVGLSTFAVVCLVYFGGVRFKGGIPGGAVAVGLGVALCWLIGLAPGTAPEGVTGLRAPVPAADDLFGSFSYLLPHLSVILAMGLFNLFGSLQNLDSAEAAGDRYATRPSLAANGVGTIVASLFGSCFPTTIYIGHPGWKGLGARLGYSWLNGAFMTVVALTGTVGWIAWAIPIEAGMAIVLWISIVITAQAFQATPRAHAPAVVIGILPGVAAWGAFMLKTGMRSLDATFDETLGEALATTGVHFRGVFAIAEGGIFTAMVLAAAVVAVIERRFRLASLWCFAGAALSFTGLMHGWRWTGGDTALELGWAVAWKAALGYTAMGVVFFVAPWIGTTKPRPQV
ncbi:MAG: NCS2 family permease [Planctomycetota bacterium]|jgi:AGZA family xanthine/uracil permease-like MFS transporter